MIPSNFITPSPSDKNRAVIDSFNRDDPSNSRINLDRDDRFNRGIMNANQNAIVKLNVGGHIFTTTLSTLIGIPGSYFKSMLNFSGQRNHNYGSSSTSNNSSRNSTNCAATGTGTMMMVMAPLNTIMPPNSAEEYFIDRDGEHFRHILNYMRCKTVVTLPDDDVGKVRILLLFLLFTGTFLFYFCCRSSFHKYLRHCNENNNTNVCITF